VLGCDDETCDEAWCDEEPGDAASSDECDEVGASRGASGHWGAV